uniref:lipase family protein n=1 Tax=Nocardia cyriacigeorgica TaxID=135487 RepID=UPI002454D650
RPMRDSLTLRLAWPDPGVGGLRPAARFGHPGNTPDMPLLMWHSWTDQLLPAELAIDDVVRRYCERGVNLRYHKVPASEHISAELVPELATVAWLVAVTAGADPGPTTC